MKEQDGQVSFDPAWLLVAMEQNLAPNQDVYVVFLPFSLSNIPSHLETTAVGSSLLACLDLLIASFDLKPEHPVMEYRLECVFQAEARAWAPESWLRFTVAAELL